MAAPAQRVRGKHFQRRRRLWKRIATDPLLAIGGDDVAGGIETRLAGVARGRLDVGRRVQAREVGGAGRQHELAPHARDLLAAHRVEQVLDPLDVAAVDHVAGLEPALGVGLDGKQLVRVGRRHRAGAQECRPRRAEDAGTQQSLAGQAKKSPPAEVVIETSKVGHDGKVGCVSRSRVTRQRKKHRLRWRPVHSQVTHRPPRRRSVQLRTSRQYERTLRCCAAGRRRSLWPRPCAASTPRSDKCRPECSWTASTSRLAACTSRLQNR